MKVTMFRFGPLLVLTICACTFVHWASGAFIAGESELQSLLRNHKTDGNVKVDLEDAKLTVPQLLTKYGYPVEVHNVTTADGYILTVHRIPYGKECGPSENKPIIWLQHGLTCDSSVWIISGPGRGLGYQLADACYDVWMGNARGNTYSKRHVTLPIENNAEYWDFSWHEMGIYDLPADFDYVTAYTGVEQLFYVGHSMGTTMFWVCMSERPEYNSRIRLMSALAPVAYTENMISPVNLIAPFANQIEWILSMLGAYELAPSGPFMDLIGMLLCNEQSLVQDICSNILFLLCGYNVDQLDLAMLPVVMGHTPAGASVRSIVHYAHGVNNGKFLKYDFGKEKNLEVYGQEVPPPYNLTRITAPVALYRAENDWLGVTSDTYRIAMDLPNLQRQYRINHNKFNHLDFIWALDQVPLVNVPVMDFLKYF